MDECVADALAAAGREARREALGEAAKAVCPMCDRNNLKGDAIMHGPAFVNVNGFWVHKRHNPTGAVVGYTTCKAGEIHALLAAEAPHPDDAPQSNVGSKGRGEAEAAKE